MEQNVAKTVENVAKTISKVQIRELQPNYHEALFPGVSINIAGQTTAVNQAREERQIRLVRGFIIPTWT